MLSAGGITALIFYFAGTAVGCRPQLTHAWNGLFYADVFLCTNGDYFELPQHKVCLTSYYRKGAEVVVVVVAVA